MILLNYKDTTPRFTEEDFDRYMNGEKYAGIGSFAIIILKIPMVSLI